MSRVLGFLTRIRRAFRLGDFSQQMNEEMQHHIEAETSRRIAAGEDPVTARKNANLAFGHAESIKEAERRRRLGQSVELFWRDLAFAARNLRKSPGFAFVAIFTLAIGIGGNTAIFSVLNGLLLNPLPYPDSQRIVQVNESPGPNAFGAAGGGSFLLWERQNEHFDKIAGSHTMSHNFSGRGDPEVVRGLEVTPQYLSVFGLRPQLGRDFRPEDDQAGSNEHVTIISHRFWQQQFDGDPNVIGKYAVFDDQGYEIIGVLEPEALLDPEIDFLSPTGILNDEMKQSFGYHYVTFVVARLKPGATSEAAAAQLTALKLQNNDLYPPRKKEWVVSVDLLQERLFGGARQSLNLLIGAVGAVLLIACVNVANLLLSKTASRRSELALRLAVGATKGRIIRQLLTESLLLSCLGGLVGIGIAAITIDPLVTFAGISDIQRLTIGLDLRVLGFALGAALLTGFLFGLIPALKAARPDVNEHLKDGARSGTSGGRRKLQSILVISETALTAILLVVAGLLIQSFVNAANEDVGFNRDGLLVFRINPSGDNASSIEKRVRYADRLLAEFRAIPGATEVALITNMPMNGRTFYGDSLQRADKIEEDNNITAGFDAISPGFFNTLDIPILAGRDLSEADNREDAHKVMLINQSMVERFFPDGEDPLGKHMIFKGDPYEVVGVVGDINRFGVDTQSPRQVYIPLAQFPWSTHFAIRTDLPPLSLIPQVRKAVQNVQPGQPIFEVDTMENLANQTLSFRTMMLSLLSIFAGASLVLACVGIYGVMAYSVTQRTREMGIRLALGAKTQGVTNMVVKDGLLVIGIGLVVGILGAVFAGRLLQNQLYEVDSFDPFTYIGVAIVLLAVGAAACFLPARRASRVDPMTSLRCE
ncbi:ABC transporter permease [Pelagicoccus sp. SDUM812003]|uniref:ABC transporter permease n=1 Tax=Pelagicoccus sp. SDUM812003 TaxID=3041267 RepID=UPI00280DDC54|nr:ABC transporter permease [Pelagicoccus sp. SDUM812003]MDQ8205393.1 ABC transporter permease [Pelagicoccus sp. SDUM812003]